MAEIKYISRENISAFLTKIKQTYVQKETGKGLSTNDFTNELLSKLNGIAENAQVNVLEGVQVNGTDVQLTGKKANIIVPTKVSDLTNDSKYLTVVSESNLESSLLEKVNASAEGNHSHSNKEELDKIATGDKAKWDQATTDVNTVKADYLKAADKTALQDAINVEKGRIDTLNGTGEGSVDKKITDAFNKFATDVTNDSVVNSYKELIDWVAEHGSEAAEMAGSITALQNILAGIGGEGEKATVVAYVTDAIAALQIGDYAKAADLTALATRVKAIEDDYVKASELVALTATEIEEIWANA